MPAKTNPGEKALFEQSEKMIMAGKKQALDLFHQAVKNSPAYNDLLKKVGLDPQKITSIKEWNQIPIIDKSFLRNKPFSDIAPDSDGIYSLALSSGSNGERLLFPRTVAQDSNAGPSFNRMWTSMYDIDKKNTLVINALTLGLTSAGTTVDTVCRNLASENPHLKVISPGAASIDEITTALEIAWKLHETTSSDGTPIVEQVIMTGYPPNTVEAVRRFKNKGYDLKKLNIKLWLMGEGHSIEWLHAMQQLLSSKGENDLNCMISLFGTSESGMTAIDTELSILIRQFAHQNREFAQELFGQNSVIPMVFQYLANVRHLEIIDGEIVVTSPGGVPIIRYNLHDRGQIVSLKDVVTLARKYKFDPFKELALRGYDPKKVAPFPFLMHYGRSDGAVSIDGAVTFPGNVEPILVDETINDHGIVTFMLDTHEDLENHKRQLHIHLELDAEKNPEEISPEQIEDIQNIIVKTLSASNGDYAYSLKENPAATIPKISLHAKDQGPFKINMGRSKQVRIAKKSAPPLS